LAKVSEPSLTYRKLSHNLLPNLNTNRYTKTPGLTSPPTTFPSILDTTTVTQRRKVYGSGSRNPSPCLPLRSTRRGLTQASTEKIGPQLVNLAEIRVIVCLLDLVMLKGIYPLLTRCVGIPTQRWTESAAFPGLVVRRMDEAQDRKDVELLELAVGRFLEFRGEDSVAGRDLV